MRLHRFFVGLNINKEKINSFPSVSLAHQLKAVFRFHEGDKAIFFDGSGNDCVSEIVSLSKTEVTFRVLETYPVKRYAKTTLSLAVSLIKKDNFEWVVQKGTELGVSEFMPLLSERSEKKSFNVERAAKIAVEASEQSGRSDIPEVKAPVALDGFLESETRPIIVFHTEGAVFKKEAFQTEGKEAVVCIGPEGGWSEKEIESFKKKGASIVRLDAPVLRAETAAIAVSTLFLL